MRKYAQAMAEPPEPDLDEKFSLYPLEGEEVLERLLGTDDEPDDEEQPDG